MCEFVSWIEKGKKKDGTPQVFFLTGKQVYKTKRGKDIVQKQGSTEDFAGHGAIRLYWGLERDEGMDEECTDFSSPANFPAEIAKAIKDGDMAGLPFPHILLTPGVWNMKMLNSNPLVEKAYAERRKANTEWGKAYAEREEADTEWGKAYAGWEEADAEWGKAYAEWEKAKAEWEKAKAEVGWDLFRNPENRIKAWR